MFLSTESGKPLHKSPNTKKIQIGRLFGIYQPNWWYGYLFSLQNKQTKHTQMLSRLWGKDDFQSITRLRTWTNFKHFATWGTWNLRFFFCKKWGSKPPGETPRVTNNNSPARGSELLKVKTVSTIEREHMMADFARRAARWIFSETGGPGCGVQRLLHVLAVGGRSWFNVYGRCASNANRRMPCIYAHFYIISVLINDDIDLLFFFNSSLEFWMKRMKTHQGSSKWRWTHGSHVEPTSSTKLSK